MQADVTDAGPFERLLTLRLDEVELESAKDAAARKLSGELKIKGFRPGKAPRPVVERMVGAERLRGEAIDEALPQLVTDALVDADLSPVTSPRIENISDQDGGGVEVEVRITLWPTVDQLPELEGRTAVLERPNVDEDEIEAQVDRIRSQFAELEDVSREGDEGDFVMINLTASANGREVEEASANDLLYEIGSKSFIPGLDELLAGSSAGDIREGPAILPQGFGDHAGEEVVLKVLVKGVKAKRLPEVTDEWVADVSEFESVDELTEQLHDNLAAMKLNAVRGEFQERLVDELSEELDVDLPEALVEAEMEASLHNLYHTLEAQGIQFADYLSITGQEEDAFVNDLRLRATTSLRTRILLEGIAAEQGIEVGPDELEAAVTDLAEQTGRDLDEFRGALAESGQDQALTGDILRRKALDRILEVATAVDAEGNLIDLTPPQTDEPRDLGHDSDPEPESSIEDSTIAADNDDE